MTRAVGWYAFTLVLIVLAIGAASAAFTGAEGRRTILVSAALALAVQMASFVVARAYKSRNLLIGWGLGSVMRLVALVCYALVVDRLWRAPLTPALLSFVGFLFATTLVEPLFLRR